MLFRTGVFLILCTWSTWADSTTTPWQSSELLSVTGQQNTDTLSIQVTFRPERPLESRVFLSADSNGPMLIMEFRGARFSGEFPPEKTPVWMTYKEISTGRLNSVVHLAFPVKKTQDFRWRWQDNRLEVTALTQARLPESKNIWLITGAAIGAAIGVLLLII